MNVKSDFDLEALTLVLYNRHLNGSLGRITFLSLGDGSLISGNIFSREPNVMVSEVRWVNYINTIKPSTIQKWKLIITDFCGGF